MSEALQIALMGPQAADYTRRAAAKQFRDATSTQPLQHWTQAAAQVVGGLGSSMRETEAAQNEQQAAQIQKDALTQALNGGSISDASTMLMGNPATADMGFQLAQSAISQRQQAAQAAAAQREKLATEERAHARAKELLNMRLEEGRREGAKYGLTPIYGRDENGNPVLLQTGTQGQVVRSQVPEGVTIDPGLAPTLKSRGSAIGKGQGEAAVDIPTVEHESGVLTRQIDELLNDSYLPSMTGNSAYLPTMTARGSSTQSRIDQINSKAFLQAFQKLKGAGAITEAEGARAQQALTRLSNQYQRDEDYAAALEEFKREVVQLAEVAKRRAGGGTQPQRRFRVIGVE